ncbi:DNA gyrase subunit A [Thermoanaerobacterium sp. RBIITD]|uniref:DNA gyrase subunit A n=1 Tax=Thermoanaerobacterium sp. RBIITD TaxID=1550240 RepID=UPI000BB96D12|nr:DNA gyrase subunit A [Thermoanaerobacterium sp. RBIITD]SNX53790.1 DNA gyrase subunit A [Thermoanaerobacterium sp. RBIITD]
MSENKNDDVNKVIPVDLEDEMKKSFIDYAMSVIVSRALPDVRDGLKPVHRRILYAMSGLGLTPDKAYKKSVAVVGEVLGKYHPHGDVAVYDAMVRMAQDFSMRETLIDGHGNFGSIDGDPPAAMRYTEARLSKISLEMLTDINKETVDFVPNFDETLKEPVVLPSRFPNLLVNGSQGIAVGMATNIPPHNLAEVINGVINYIDNPYITTDELMKYIKGPDFPTGALIVGKDGIRQTYETGRGKIIVRAKAEIEEHNGRNRIIVTEIPYMVVKAKLVEKIAELAREKHIEGISDLRDESDRNGMKIVIDLKRDANPKVILNKLYMHTQMQQTFGAIMLALVDGTPKILTLKQIIEKYVDHQADVITRRTKYDLKKTEERAHILEGLKIALDHIDEVINIIRSSKTEPIAKKSLMDRFGFSDRQAQAIVDMRLGRLTGLERQKVEDELNELYRKIEELKGILADERKVLDIIRNELTEIKNKFSSPRKTHIVAKEDEMDIEDLVQLEDAVVTMTHFGYIKRMPLDAYKSQKRGGKGISGISTREDDFVENVFITTTHDRLLFFTNKGKVYSLRTIDVPESGRQAKGTAIINLIQIEQDEKVNAVIPIKKSVKAKYVVMCTKNGIIKKTKIDDFPTIKKSGNTAIKLDDGDELINVKLTDGDREIIIGTSNGYCIRFHEDNLRPIGRQARGVIAISLRDDDYVVEMDLVNKDSEILVVTENGFGKRSDLEEYRTQTRAGKGIIATKITKKTGKLVAIMSVKAEDELMIISANGILIRTNISDISKMHRDTTGVTLMKLDEGDRVVSTTRINNVDSDE